MHALSYPSTPPPHTHTHTHKHTFPHTCARTHTHTHTHVNKHVTIWVLTYSLICYLVCTSLARTRVYCCNNCVAVAARVLSKVNKASLGQLHCFFNTVTRLWLCPSRLCSVLDLAWGWLLAT